MNQVKNILRSATLLALVFVTGNSIADNHSQEQQSIANLMVACSLNEGKTVADAMQAVAPFRAWASKNFPGISIMLAPVYRTGDYPADIIFANYLSYTDLPAVTESWESDGSKASEAIASVMTCNGQSLNTFVPGYTSEAFADDADGQFIWTIDHCTRNDGVAWESVGTALRSASANAEKSDFKGSFGMMLPGFGADREAEGEFSRIIVYPNMEVLAEERNNYYNQDGWKLQRDFQTNVASCTSRNAYGATVIKAPAD